MKWLDTQNGGCTVLAVRAKLKNVRKISNSWSSSNQTQQKKKDKVHVKCRLGASWSGRVFVQVKVRGFRIAVASASMSSDILCVYFFEFNKFLQGLHKK